MKRNWLITGVNSGFGRQMTEILLARGDRVAGTVRKFDSMNDLKRRYGDQLWLAELDLVAFANIRPAVDRAFAAFGRIDVVVSNAGYGLFGAVEGLSDEQVLNQISINLTGSIQLIRASLPYLRGQGGGRIVQLSTYGGQATHAGASLYHASKWGIEGFAESLAQEVAPFNIGVTIVEPGGARTAFRAAAGANLGQELEAYAGTPAGMVHRVLRDPARQPNGDPVKMAKAIIASVDQDAAPRRLVLGSDSYAAIHKALTDRLSEVEAQKTQACAVDLVATA